MYTLNTSLLTPTSSFTGHTRKHWKDRVMRHVGDAGHMNERNCELIVGLLLVVAVGIVG